MRALPINHIHALAHTNSYAPTNGSKSITHALAANLGKCGLMSKRKNENILIRNGDQKGLDISINKSHNRHLSDNGVIQLVKLLARQAAEEDYLRSIQSDQDEVTS